MTDLEQTVRAAFAGLLRKVRADAPVAWLDEAVAEIVKAAGSAPAVIDPQKVDAARQMTRSETDAWLSRLADLETLGREMLAAFTKGPNGYSARVKQSQVEEWEQRLGGQA